jgi:DNA repair exonuclease SbcCD nuclease subunit
MTSAHISRDRAVVNNIHLARPLMGLSAYPDAPTDIPVYLLYGNHDAKSEMTRGLDLPDNVLVFSSPKRRSAAGGG